MSLPYQGVGDTTYYNNDYNVTTCTGQSTISETQGSPVSVRGSLGALCRRPQHLHRYCGAYSKCCSFQPAGFDPNSACLLLNIHEQQKCHLTYSLMPRPTMEQPLGHTELCCMLHL